MENNSYSNIQEINNKNLQPMTIKDWLITMLLMLIPFVNIVLIFVWAFGSDVNKSKKTFFQAQLIFAGITLIIFTVLALVLGAAFFNITKIG